MLFQIVIHIKLFDASRQRYKNNPSQIVYGKKLIIPTSMCENVPIIPPQRTKGLEAYVGNEYPFYAELQVGYSL